MMKRINGLSFLEYLKENIMLLDGATGTYLHAKGMEPGVCPEVFALEHRDLVRGYAQGIRRCGLKSDIRVYAGRKLGKAQRIRGRTMMLERINRQLAAYALEAAGR